MSIFNSLQQKQQDRLKENEESKSMIDLECFCSCIVYVVNKLCHSGAWPTVTVYRLAGRNKLSQEPLKSDCIILLPHPLIDMPTTNNLQE